MSATTSYQKISSECEDKMKQIKALLKQHSAKQKKDSQNWGYVGDIALVSSELDNVLTTLKP